MRDSKEIGKLGGKSRSARKSEAARRNGAKGGRPPKKPPSGDTSEYLLKRERHLVVKNVEKCLLQSRAEGRADLRTIFLALAKKEVRAELIRKGRRDLWLRYLKVEREERNHEETYEEYLERMRFYRVTPPLATREVWEQRQIEKAEWLKPKHAIAPEIKT